MNEQKWSEAVDLCRNVLSDEGSFVGEEREYKLGIAERVRAALAAIEGGEDFVPLLTEALEDPPNNLLDWRVADEYRKWYSENSGVAGEGLQLLVAEDLPLEERVDEFLSPIPRANALSGRGSRAALASLFLMGLDPATYPMFRPRPFEKVEQVLDYPKVPADASSGAIYSHHLSFARQLLRGLEDAGLKVEDVLDAQTLVWILANDKGAQIASWRGETPTVGKDPWFEPLKTPPGIEEDLQRLLADGATAEARETLGAAFRRAILLHQRVGTDGFLGGGYDNGKTFSVMVGSLFACGVSNNALNLLVDDAPGAWEAYDVSPSAITDNELVWARVGLNPPALESLLRDEEAWSAYERMLRRFYVFRRARSNHHNVGKMSVLTGERLGHGDERLTGLVSRFLKERGYPTEKDRRYLDAREEFASYLSPEAVENLDWEKFKLIYNSNKYGRTGPMAGLNRYVNDSDEEGLEKLRRAVEHLLYADHPLENRLDDVLTGDLRVGNFGEAVATKLLSICYPDRVLPIFVFKGPKGKAALMGDPALELAVPQSGSRGELAVKANDLLRGRLKPYFADDTNEMKEFLYWLHSRGEEAPPLEIEKDALAVLAEDLLIEKEFLEEVLEMVREKKQIIFYGPPGTGKTYLARKISEHLAGEVARREVVQFHPSYSYEDFVQGYRPVVRDDGNMIYEPKPGPLMRMAQLALDSSQDHVLLIDEINRGNLPKILGELLYLLEYRDDEVALMYGEDGERFAMPENLLIIGTMNTADRSIALIDTALRRRFHFVPLFPNEKPIEGLLKRWLSRHCNDMVKVADVVDRLNEKLRDDFGPHLQVGPAYFMRKDLSERVLRRVWDYDVKPFLEEHFFGREGELEDYKLERLRGDTDAGDQAGGAPDEDGVPDEG